MKKTLVKSLALAFVGSLLVAGSALAIPTISVSDGTTTKIIGDGSTVAGAYDAADTDAGWVSWSGNVGNFTTTVESGSTMPLVGSATYPLMNFSSEVRNNSDTAGVLTVMFSETLFGPLDGSGISGWLTSLGVDNFGGPADMVNLNAYYDTSGALFGTNTLGTATEIANFDNQLDGPTVSQGMVGVPSGYFSLTLVGQFVHAANTKTHTEFSSTLQPVPEPATMLLLGTGLVGLAGVRRRKAQK